MIERAWQLALVTGDSKNETTHTHRLNADMQAITPSPIMAS